jgi:N-acetylglutamate synthase-like GNAT family acetyltransferase
MIRLADEKDITELAQLESHLSTEKLTKKIQNGEEYLYLIGEKIVGCLRFSYFWDEVPFMNLLNFLEDYRGKGYGTEIVEYWEAEMKKSGHQFILTSSLANEQAQHFYRKLGYIDSGALFLPGEAAEIVFYKKLN